MIGDGWSRWYFHEEVRKAVVSDLTVYCLSCSQKTLQILIKNAYFFIYSFLAIPILLRYAKLAIEKGLAQGRDGSYIQQLYMNYFTKLKLYIKQL